VACAAADSSLTVAGQWRIFTALPEHLASEMRFYCALRKLLKNERPPFVLSRGAARWSDDGPQRRRRGVDGTRKDQWRRFISVEFNFDGF
jgi:hypothetical protein